MNASADIRAWLASSQDFRQGAALYAQVGTSAAFKRLFTLGATDYSQQVLQRELSALVPTEAPAASASPASLLVPAAEPPPPTTEAPPPATGVADALLTDLAQQLKAARDERSHLHPQLTAKGVTKKARLGLCARIVELTDREVALLAQQAHVRQHGRLPGPVPLAEVTDPGELRRLLTNRRALRSKLKKDPTRAADLARVQADIDLLTQKLNS